MQNNKIIIIGLQKTGTLSLRAALGKLGYKPKHGAPELICNDEWGGMDIVSEELRFAPYDVDLEILETYDAICDTPVFFDFVYKKIYDKYPDAKYILTTRSKQSWVKSAKNHVYQANYKIMLVDRIKNYSNYDPYKDKIFTCDNLGALEYLYDAPYAQITDSVIESCYDRHHTKVDEFFRNNAGNFLKMDLTEGDGWDKLCEFLQVEKPMAKFPHRNETIKVKEEVKEKKIYKVAEKVHSDVVKMGKKMLNKLA